MKTPWQIRRRVIERSDGGMQPTSSFCNGRWTTTQAPILCHHTSRRNPMEVALYVRVSTTRQQQTRTIEQQIARLREHLATHPDWHLGEEHIYRDDGYSGAKLNRPGLDRMRDCAAMAGFERILITAPGPSNAPDRRTGAAEVPGGVSGAADESGPTRSTPPSNPGCRGRV
jgi:predicted site-specific integrase-resolvase